MFIMLDTCQASTMFEHINSTKVITVGSSSRGENSIGNIEGPIIGTQHQDRFTHKALEVIALWLIINRVVHEE